MSEIWPKRANLGTLLMNVFQRCVTLLRPIKCTEGSVFILDRKLNVVSSHYQEKDHICRSVVRVTTLVARFTY